MLDGSCNHKPFERRLTLEPPWTVEVAKDRAVPEAIAMLRSRQHRHSESRAHVPFSWVSLYQRTLDELDLLDVVRRWRAGPLLRSLIALLQFGETSEPSSPLEFPTLDRRLKEIFPNHAAIRVAAHLESADHLIFFSKWQLLFAIKLACAFGSRNADAQDIDLDHLLDLLLMVNDFYPGRASPQESREAGIKPVQEAILRQYALVQHETPHHLIGRYAEIFGTLAAPPNRSQFRDWVDIREIVESQIGVDLDTYKAILFALFSNAMTISESAGEEPKLGFRGLHPEDWFSQTLLSRDQWIPVLDSVATTPDEIREQHTDLYKEGIGNPIDLGLLLRKPVLRLDDNTVAVISGHLIIQRYTCGLYWDVNNALPDVRTAEPNRGTFQRFFGQLHENYCRGVLQRIADAQQMRDRKVHLFKEGDYGSGTGSNPDNLMVEFVDENDKRCLLFESKVGRPRYKDSIVEGDVEAFQRDLLSKIGDGLNQEIDLCRRFLAREREIYDLPIYDALRWFFVVVVTDPYPAMGILLEPLRERLAVFGETANVRLYGPFILSLSELEQLEMLPEARVSDLLMEWHWGQHKDWPFNTFFAYRTEGEPISNEYVAQIADDDLGRVPQILFGHTP